MKYNFLIDENEDGIRLDNYLAGVFSEVSRSQIQRQIKSRNALVNGGEKKSSYQLRADDKIEFEMQEQKAKIIEPQDIALEIVYEDENMLVVNKPSGMLTHPTSTERENTLVNALLFKYGENLSDINGELRRGILHRLDRNTSGLLMVAKNNAAHQNLAEQIKTKMAMRKYLAVANKPFEKSEGIINLPIGRHPHQPHKMAVVEGGKPSITEFKVLERFKDYTYIELTLQTGRTHQIRVHLSHKRHPIANDTLYGGGKFKVKLQEQVLQAYKLSFTKPFSNDIINLEIAPDEKIQKALNYLKNKGG